MNALVTEIRALPLPSLNADNTLSLANCIDLHIVTLASRVHRLYNVDKDVLLTRRAIQIQLPPSSQRRRRSAENGAVED